MKYEDYAKLRDYLAKVTDKLYIKRNNVEEFILKCGEMRSAKVTLAHVEELINNLEEAINLCDWFMDKD